MNKEAVGTLTGKYFLSVKSDRTTIEWAGKFLGLASPGLYRVEILGGFWYGEGEQRLVPATDMRYWIIFDSERDMSAYYEKYQSAKKESAKVGS